MVLSSETRDWPRQKLKLRESWMKNEQRESRKGSTCCKGMKARGRVFVNDMNFPEVPAEVTGVWKMRSISLLLGAVSSEHTHFSFNNSYTSD